jgi:DNA repair exonuclease SbcCD ATPase subunit
MRREISTMKRATTALFCAPILLTLACGAGDKERAKLAEVQRQADERVAHAEADAREKIAALEKKVDELQGQVAEAGAQAKAAAEDEIASAKGDAEKFASQAAAALAKARAAYKDSGQKQLAALGKEADELRSKAAKTPTPKTKPQIDLALKDVSAKRELARKDLQEFDGATLDSIKGVKVKVDKAMAELKRAVQTLRVKVT